MQTFELRRSTTREVTVQLPSTLNFAATLQVVAQAWATVLKTTVTGIKKNLKRRFVQEDYVSHE